MNDMQPLLAHQAVDALAAPLAERRLDASQSLAGTPIVGTATLAEMGGVSVGLWEMAPSTSTDVEIDEVFVVLSGEATVSFADGSPPMELRPGVVARLAAGARTTWTVRQKLRKLYIA